MAMKVVYTNFCGQLVHEDRGGVETEYVPDTLGSVMMCRSASGTTTYTADYWPYGEVADSTGTNPSPWGFVGTLGYYTDSVPGSLYVRARIYLPSIGRWATVDPLWPNEPAYPYCACSPRSWVDPDGTYWYPTVRPPHRLPPRGRHGRLAGFEYGQYCGSAREENPGQAVLPQDCLDACCQIHDRCIEAHYGAGYDQIQAHKCCDDDLHNCAEWVRNRSNDCCKCSPMPKTCYQSAGTVTRGMWFNQHIYYRTGPVQCVPKSQWPALVRKWWGDPYTPHPPGPMPPREWP